MRRIVSNYTDACDTRVEVMEDGKPVSTAPFAAKDWISANRVYGRLAASGFHVRLVATGLTDHVISEVFGLLEDGHHAGPCPSCGAVCVIDHKSDPTGRRIIADHWSGDHRQCHPDGCAEESPGEGHRVRSRKESKA